MINVYTQNTLQYDRETCTGCGMCRIVCPHRVFQMEGRKAKLVHPEKCMECGACRTNCPSGSITVDSGVGCATAMILAAVKGLDEPSCGPNSCCG